MPVILWNSNLTEDVFHPSVSHYNITPDFLFTIRFSSQFSFPLKISLFNIYPTQARNACRDLPQSSDSSDPHYFRNQQPLGVVTLGGVVIFGGSLLSGNRNRSRYIYTIPLPFLDTRKQIFTSLMQINDLHKKHNCFRIEIPTFLLVNINNQ